MMRASGVGNAPGGRETGPVRALPLLAYGLGSIKAMTHSLMVVSTAMSPIPVGIVLDGERGLEALLFAAMASVAVGAALTLRLFSEHP
jgi:hypothetical protein